MAFQYHPKRLMCMGGGRESWCIPEWGPRDNSLWMYSLMTVRCRWAKPMFVATDLRGSWQLNPWLMKAICVVTSWKTSHKNSPILCHAAKSYIPPSWETPRDYFSIQLSQLTTKYKRNYNLKKSAICSAPLIVLRTVTNILYFVGSNWTSARTATMRALIFLVLATVLKLASSESSRVPFVISPFANSLSARSSADRMSPRWLITVSKLPCSFWYSGVCVPDTFADVAPVNCQEYIALFACSVHRYTYQWR